MTLIAYLDETGDHSLVLVDRDFPLFALALFICDEDEYARNIVPAVYKLKMDFFGHEAVILHSRDIRKAQKDFSFLTEPDIRRDFYDRINEIMEASDYTIIASVIHKQAHKERYGVNANNPYDLALKFALERLLPMLEDLGQKRIQLVAESRGKKENDELMLSFLNVVSQGTEYISASRFKQIDFKMKFVSKQMNVVGTQLADLVAYPAARYALNQHKPNPAYEILKKKFYKGRGAVRGLKVFP